MHSETSYNQAVLWPVMMACTKYIRRVTKDAITFFPGEEELFSMTTAGPATSPTPYYADGLLRMSDMSNTELCLLETYKALRKSNNAKVSFDHHKGMFALLSMLKRVADRCNYATYDQFSNLELVFLHAHGMYDSFFINGYHY